MKEFRLNIELANDAFHPDPAPEIIRILKTVICRLEIQKDHYEVKDFNGNCVGTFRIGEK